MENVWIQVRAIGPYDRSQLGVYGDFAEPFWVAQRCEDSSELYELLDINDTFRTVREPEMDSILLEWPRFHNVDQHFSLQSANAAVASAAGVIR